MRLILLLLFFRLPYLSTAQSCDTATGNSTNLGIYGGLALDLAFADNGRLFAAASAPASLLISDDTAQTWYRAFPDDSLEYECGLRGWGGTGERVLTNRKGWVAVLTNEALGDLSSSVISFQNGDSGSWQTAIDPYALSQMGYVAKEVSGIALSDYYLYVSLQSYIAKIDSSGRVDASDIIDIKKEISGIDTATAYVSSIAIANTASGTPFYIIVDSIGSVVGSPKGKLYKYDGVLFSQISIPSEFVGLSKVFTHPNQITGDTLFIVGRNSSKAPRNYRSLDGGISWTEMITAPIPAGSLKDVDYSPYWKFPMSNGILLIHESNTISTDMGSSWQIENKTLGFSPFSTAIYPNDTNIILRSSIGGNYIGYNGLLGAFTKRKDEGFEAILVWEIARNNNKTIFYLATRSGLAYTTKYKDGTINYIDKWADPYGKFPVDGTVVAMGGTGITNVAIDPYDSLHVVAGMSTGLLVSHTGPDGFFSVEPTGYRVKNSSMFTRDIAFVTSDIVLAVTGTEDEVYQGNGDIWRSNDGGDSWAIVSPSSVGTPITIGIGYGSSDTAIYVGTGLKALEPGKIWKSTDLGLSWSKVNMGPSAYNDPSVQDLSINQIAVDPRGKDTLYIVAGYDTSLAFVKSTDGGLTYQHFNLDAYGEGKDWIAAIEIDPANPDSIIYTASGRFLHQFNPALDSVQHIFTGLPGDAINDIAIGSILVGTTTGFYGIEKEADIVTSISPANKNNHIALFVYPNPITNEAFIKVEGFIGMTKELNITLYDVMGRPVKEISYNNYSSDKTIRFDASLLSNGIYYLKIDTGIDTISEKVVIVKN